MCINKEMNGLKQKKKNTHKKKKIGGRKQAQYHN